MNQETHRMAEPVKLPAHIKVMASQVVDLEGTSLPKATEARGDLVKAVEKAGIPLEPVEAHMQTLREAKLGVAFQR